MKTSTMSFTAALEKAAVPADEKKAKKSSAPKIDLPGDLGKQLDAYLAAKKAMKEAETVMDTNGALLIEHARAIQDKDAWAGHFAGSYDLISAKSIAKFITVDKFGVSQQAEAIEALKALVGEKFGEVVEQKSTVTLKAEVLASEELQKELMTAIGNKFAKFFDVVTKYTAKDDLKERQYSLTGSQAKLEEFRSYVIQNKPSIR